MYNGAACSFGLLIKLGHIYCHIDSKYPRVLMLNENQPHHQKENLYLFICVMMVPCSLLDLNKKANCQSPNILTLCFPKGRETRSPSLCLEKCIIDRSLSASQFLSLYELHVFGSLQDFLKILNYINESFILFYFF